MNRRMSKCVVILLAAVTLLAGAAPVAAQGVGSAPPSRRSTAARVTWTVIGAGAGFALGAWYGLHKFDDATNSDRKVWISAIVGAAAGGVAGGLLSRNLKPAPDVPPSRIAWPDGSPAAASLQLSGGSPEDRLLRLRVRAVNASTSR